MVTFVEMNLGVKAWEAKEQEPDCGVNDVLVSKHFPMFGSKEKSTFPCSKIEKSSITIDEGEPCAAAGIQ